MDTGKGLTGAYVGYKITNLSGANYADLWIKLEGFTGGVINLAANEDGIFHVGPLATNASTMVYFYLNATSTTTVAQTHTVSLYNTKPTLATAVCGDSFSLLTSEDTIAAASNKVSTVVTGPTPNALGGQIIQTVTGATGTIGAAGIFAFTPASVASWPANAYQLVKTEIKLGTATPITDTLYLSGLNGSLDYIITYTYVVTGIASSPTSVSPVGYISSGTQIKHTDTSGYASLPPITPASNTTTLSKSASPTNLPTGGTANYTVTVTNTSTNSAVTLDNIIDTLPSTPGTATYVLGSAKFNGVTISNPTITGQQLSFLGLFTVPASSSRTLTYQATLPATNGTYTNQVTGRIDATVIDTTIVTTDNQPATAAVTVGTPAQMLLVKRITGVKNAGDPSFGTTNPNDATPLNLKDNTNPSFPTDYIVGAKSGGKIKSGDEVEYTIYYVNSGGNSARSAKICDRLSSNLIFNPNTYQAGKGGRLVLGDNTTVDLTNQNDTTVDRGQFLTGTLDTTTQTNCNLTALNDPSNPSSPNNPSGTLILDLTGTTGAPTLTSIPPLGTSLSRGLFKFTATVK